MDPFDAGMTPVESIEEFEALRADWATRPIEPLFTTREGRPTVQAPSGPIYVMLRGEETGGRVGFYDQVSAVGAAISAHHQTSEDETFYVVEGDWEFRAGDDVRIVGPGTLVYAPAGTTHAFKAVSGDDGTARVISWNAPAGHERFYVGMGAAKAKGLNPRVDAAPLYHTVFGG